VKSVAGFWFWYNVWVIRPFPIALASILLLACSAAAQTKSLPQNKIEALLAAAGVKVQAPAASPQAGQTIAFAGTKEMRLRWESPATPSRSDTTAQAGGATRKFRALKVTKYPGTAPRQRSPELSTEHLVVAGLDEDGRLRSWTIILDPRLLRAESPDPAGGWKRENFYRTEAEFLVALPDDPAVTRLDFFHPRWNGESFVLDPLGTASIP
jgi:hypothetical protein